MSKPKSTGIAPKLRFPEFLNEGEWSERKLGEIGSFLGGGTPSTSNPEYWNGNIQWYTPTEIKNETLKPSIRTISEEGLKNSSTKLLPKGTILITTRATIGDAALANKECTTNQGFQSLIVKETEVNLFWYYWIILHKHELIRRSSGSTFKEIGKNKIKIISTFSPNKKEQQKIAACLASLDGLISAATGRLDALRQHKKGLMQQLFPAAGETVPKLRFPEFREMEDWEVKPLNTFCKIQTGKKDANEGGEEGKYPFFTCSEKHIYSNSYSFDTEAILIAGNANVGQTKYYSGKFEAYQRTYILYGFKKIKVSYLHALLSATLQKSLIKRVQSSAMSYIKLSMLKEHLITLPPDAEEQQKIAACLASLDDLISAATGRCDALKQYKKGLMQQLFLTTDERAT